MRNALAGCGALVAGRHVFDIAEGWGGTHPLGGVPIFVVTHEPPTDWPHTEIFTFVDGVEKAVALAQDAAGDRYVAVASAKITQQCLDAGLLDAINVDLVPIMLGHGVR